MKPQIRLNLNSSQHIHEVLNVNTSDQGRLPTRFLLSEVKHEIKNSTFGKSSRCDMIIVGNNYQQKHLGAR